MKPINQRRTMPDLFRPIATLKNGKTIEGKRQPYSDAGFNATVTGISSMLDAHKPTDGGVVRFEIEDGMAIVPLREIESVRLVKEETSWPKKTARKSSPSTAPKPRKSVTPKPPVVKKSSVSG
jgi:hypothetical protein